MSLERRSSARQVVKSLIKDDGWTGFYRGLGPRFFSMSAWGTTMILAYEYLSMGSFSFTNIFFLDNEITNLRILTLLLSDFGASKNNVVCKSLTAFHNLPLIFLLVQLAPFGTP
jgi:solute carrier family 25 protein 44